MQKLMDIGPQCFIPSRKAICLLVPEKKINGVFFFYKMAGRLSRSCDPVTPKLFVLPAVASPCEIWLRWFNMFSRKMFENNCYKHEYYSPGLGTDNPLGGRIFKPTFYICENKDADQLRGDREADQRLCFRY